MLMRAANTVQGGVQAESSHSTAAKCCWIMLFICGARELMDMVEIINKLGRVERELLQRLGREATARELAAADRVEDDVEATSPIALTVASGIPRIAGNGPADG